MKSDINLKPKTILVLTEFTRRDRNATDAALKLAIKLETNIMLFNSYPVLFPGFSDYVEEDDVSFISEMKTNFQKEKERLEKLVDTSNVTPFLPLISSAVKRGALCENVHEILATENIILIIMGGRPLKDNNLLFCSEINDILDQANRPVLVIPENQVFDV